MRNIFIVILIILLNNNIKSQNYILEYNYGYGVYNLDDLNRFQSELLSFTYPFSLKQVEKFPNYFFHSLLFSYKISNKDYIGLNGSFMTTGARNDLKDYSGEVKQDLILNGFKAGVNYRRQLFSKNKFNFYMQLKSGIIFSSLKITEGMNLNQIDTSINTSAKFKTTVPFFEPEVITKYFITEKITLNINLGYEIDIKSKLKYTNDDIYLYHLDKKYVLLDWSGFRSSIGFSFQF
jgi:hypothetical protein